MKKADDGESNPNLQIGKSWRVTVTPRPLTKRPGQCRVDRAYLILRQVITAFAWSCFGRFCVGFVSPFSGLPLLRIVVQDSKDRVDFRSAMFPT